MRRVRFAPSPTGSLHIGNALIAAANRAFGDWFLLRIDDTDQSRNVEGGEREIARDLEWLGITWDDGPVRQSERQDHYRAAAERLGGERFGKITLLRPDGTATYHLASVVDDVEFEITHVVRGADHRPNERLHRELTEALGATPPDYVHVGLILAQEGGKLSKRDPMSSVADLRDAGIPAEAVRAYLDELGMPKHDVQLDLSRIHRLAVEAIAAMSDEELAARVGVSPALVPAVRGARDLEEAREYARQILEPEPVQLPAEARPTIERFRELVDGEARETVRELKAAGGDLRALRLALTGRERGPELWTVIHALPREEALRRVDAAAAEPPVGEADDGKASGETGRFPQVEP
jgi:glutamyl/glutaminyl-tRNA synthetase